MLPSLPLLHGTTRMSQMKWQIVCPDGHVRHHAYVNKGDALFDAKIFDQRCRRFAVPNEFEYGLPPCEGKPHTVVAAPAKTPPH